MSNNTIQHLPMSGVSAPSLDSAPVPMDASALSPDALILLVANQCKASDTLINKYIADHNNNLAVKKAISDVLSVIDANATGINGDSHDGDFSKTHPDPRIATMTKSLDDAIAHATDPQIKQELVNVKNVLLNGNAETPGLADDKVVKEEMDNMKEMLKDVSSNLSAADESFMMTMQQEMDQKKQICDLGSQWLAKMNDTAQTIVSNMKA